MEGSDDRDQKRKHDTILRAGATRISTRSHRAERHQVASCLTQGTHLEATTLMMMKFTLLAVVLVVCVAAVRSTAQLDPVDVENPVGCRLHKRSASDGYTALLRPVRAAPSGAGCRAVDHANCAKECLKLDYKAGNCCCGCDAMLLCWCHG
ncbi:uncharacterized protein LOC117644983 isoform X2 [Thrips palmi]|uniref:Uncharacterized protein LOC117644983 isoform X2 n=1 Tax=Thrips palmi TaxID=161013 RepID=A0A6P8YTE6_THRPL|nr:uncharacterized protein LOC117644983 isoform X2 [Thrips palmi]